MYIGLYVAHPKWSEEISARFRRSSPSSIQIPKIILIPWTFRRRAMKSRSQTNLIPRINLMPRFRSRISWLWYKILIMLAWWIHYSTIGGYRQNHLSMIVIDYRASPILKTDESLKGTSCLLQLGAPFFRRTLDPPRCKLRIVNWIRLDLFNLRLWICYLQSNRMKYQTHLQHVWQQQMDPHTF